MKELRDDMKQLRVDTAYIRGKLEHLPSTWVMLAAIIGGQAVLVGLLVAGSHLLAPCASDRSAAQTRPCAPRPS